MSTCRKNMQRKKTGIRRKNRRTFCCMSFGLGGIMVNINDAQKIINTAMKSGGDFAEIYCETKNELAIKYSDEFVEGINTTKIFGIGIYLLRGEKSVYVYTNNVNYDNIQQLAEKASFLISKTQDNYTQKNIVFTDSVIVNPNKYIIKPSNVSHKEKIKILKETAAAAKITERNLKQLDIKYFDSEQNIEIYNSEGLRTGDFRVNSRIRLSATVSSDKGSHGDWGDVTKPQGFEGFKNNNDHVKFAKDFIKDLSLSLNAKPVSSCSVPIVFEGGSCGTFWHETCGHQLESSAVIKDSSDFKDLIGEKVASEKVTLIDDGTLEGMYGSAAIDDEGTP